MRVSADFFRNVADSTTVRRIRDNAAILARNPIVRNAGVALAGSAGVATGSLACGDDPGRSLVAAGLMFSVVFVARPLMQHWLAHRSLHAG